MKKQALTLAIAAALSAPSALAATDTSGMQYTSASEGFYASLRARLDFGSENTKNGKSGAGIDGNASRIGVRGTNDLGGGMEGFYQWEYGVSIANGNNADNKVRLGNVGLRGAFGEVVVGSFWTNDYNWTHGSTDQAAWYSASARGDGREGRTSRSIQYTSPDLNGFKGALRARFINNPVDHDDNAATPNKDENDVDSWNVAAKYSVQGFDIGVAYNSIADGLSSTRISGSADDVQAAIRLFDGPDNGTDPDYATALVTRTDKTDDLTGWTIKLGYSQDNWYVNGWYGQDQVSDAAATFMVDLDGAGNDPAVPVRVKSEDTTIISLASGITLDKVALYAIWEQQENSDKATASGASVTSSKVKDAYATLGARYALGSNSSVWLEYYNRDLDSDKKAKDVFSVGMQHNF